MGKVTLSEVSRTFTCAAGNVPALTRVNLAIAPGEFLCIVGPSGCGKSTLLNIIAGFEHPDAGQVCMDGKPVTGPAPERFVIFQEPALFPWLNVRDNVAFGLRMAGIDSVTRQRRSDELLRMVHLEHVGGAWVHQLSGGMKQRVALARALALDPEVLLMDEPFAALDAQTRDLLHEELEAIWEKTGKTIVFVTHNVREAVRLGSRVILMSANGTIRRIYPIDLPRHRYLEDVAVVTIASQIRDELRHEVMAARNGIHGN